jgi:Tfp pilus assembly protein PilN
LKRLRHNKLLGIAIGESSLVVAEVIAGQRPRISRAATFVYPTGTTLQDAPALGAALADFLRDNHFSTRTAVVGLPAKWLLVKPKEVPPANAETLSGILRLQAEGEFSSELKDLVYDYAGEADAAKASWVLLMAAPRRQIENLLALCKAAKLNLVAIMPSALALGAAVSPDHSTDNALVLSVSAAGAELTAQRGGRALALRHLRAADSERLFVSELRRTISTMPPADAPREIILWDDTGMNSATLAKSLGMSVRGANLASLRVESPLSNGNGEDGRYGAAVALALAGLSPPPMPIDFLHPRIAAALPRRFPRWVIPSVAAAILLIALGIYAWNDLLQQQADVAKRQQQVDQMQPELKVAEAFVSRISFAQAWHGDEPRYLACLRDLTEAFPEDGTSYATALTIHGLTTTVQSKTIETGLLAGQLSGKTSEQQRVSTILDKIKRSGAFADVTLGGTQDAGRGREVAFTITFVYHPPARSAGAATMAVAGARQNLQP